LGAYHSYCSPEKEKGGGMVRTLLVYRKINKTTGENKLPLYAYDENKV